MYQHWVLFWEKDKAWALELMEQLSSPRWAIKDLQLINGTKVQFLTERPVEGLAQALILSYVDYEHRMQSFNNEL